MLVNSFELAAFFLVIRVWYSRLPHQFRWLDAACD